MGQQFTQLSSLFLSSSKIKTQQQHHQPLIGGPGTIIPQPIESLLSWTLCLSCLSVSGYHYFKSTCIKPLLSSLIATRRRCFQLLPFSSSSSSLSPTKNVATATTIIDIPLMTCTRDELSRCTPDERLDQLRSLLLSRRIDIENSNDDDALVNAIRNDECCRRLASLALHPSINNTSIKTDDASLISFHQRLVSLYDRLLALPSPPRYKKTPYDISLIVPLYRENPTIVTQRLTHALITSTNPSQVELILVDAGGPGGGDCGDAILRNIMAKEGDGDDDNSKTNEWGKIHLLRYDDGGGRGPCLNAGAKVSSGTYLVFCHADTLLPRHWDDVLRRTFDDSDDDGSSRVIATAFAFGIDTSPEGLRLYYADGSTTIGDDDVRIPPGLRAVEYTANLRSRFYSLPYGDQAITLPSVVFHYVGGFPDQCLMEDYELISLLRRRTVLLRRSKERLVIIDDATAKCSPRRWQKYGVLYVTFMNSKFVNLYAGGLGADDLYRLYYGGDPPKRRNELGEWECRLTTASRYSLKR